MPNTRGNLAPATIENLSSGDKVYCMFNPHEYTITKKNTWEAGETKGKNIPKLTFKQGGAESLKMQLFFDTFGEGNDVREHTDGLWKLMMVTEDKKNQKNNKSEPPQVAFHWGGLYFTAVITSLSQKFTLFDKDGIPLRTTVDVEFQQVEDPEEQSSQNPTSGGGPPLRTHQVQAGERLDWIAAQIYGQSGEWRRIALANGLNHPLHLRVGQRLVIPPLD